jgi:hypothetical protein
MDMRHSPPLLPICLMFDGLFVVCFFIFCAGQVGVEDVTMMDLLPFFMICAFLISVASIMFVYFKRKQWI